MGGSGKIGKEFNKEAFVDCNNFSTTIELLECVKELEYDRETEKNNMVSFDIFDTLITRKTFYSYGIFMIVQKLICTKLDERQYHYFCNNFCALRIGAEKDARLYAEQKGEEEVTLDEIYNLLGYRNNLSNEIIKYIKKLEIQAEIDNTYPIISNIRILEKLLLEGQQVVLITDMYLSEKVIRDILIKSSLVFCHIPIYVSSELKKTKYSGSLFFEVAKNERVSFSNWVHYGDNKRSDYLLPKMLGIDARPVQPMPLNSWEREIGKKLALENNLTLQFYYGIARNLRLEKNLSRAGQIGASIGGMILYPYVLWLIFKSIENGIKRLYFIARDGYILKRITDLIIKAQQLDIHTTYIYGSRKAWRAKEFLEKDKELLIKYLEQEMDFSDDRFAFVDLNGSGFTMECLAEIIFKYFKVKTTAYYFDLIENRMKDFCTFLSFYPACSGMVELFCRAPHGVTVGYKQEEGKIVPKLQKVYENCWKKAGLYDYLEGVELFVEKLSALQYTHWMLDMNIVRTVLEYCQKEPCKEIQDFLGDMPHSNENEDEKLTYAPVLSAKDIFRLFMWRTIEDLSDCYSGADLKLSLQRTDHKYDREKSFLERNYYRLLGRSIHKLKSRKNTGKCCKNVIIYAAGDMGKRLYGHLSSSSEFCVKAWTDMDYEKYYQLGYPMTSFQDSLKMDFHYIIIALNNSVICKQIQTLLEKLGVEEEKIITYKAFLEKYER